MSKEEYNVIGLMSGTSLDGIDLVYTTIDPANENFEIISCETVPYSEKWHGSLKDPIYLKKNQLEALDLEYTNLLVETVSAFIKKHNIDDIKAICSHGHTILHQPENKLTYQIGNRKELAIKTGYKVVCDFRVQDVEFGGQGAPLVPIGDRLLFGNYDYCMNLGGFANVSFESDNERIAFDISPVNIVMNHYCDALGLQYDDRGRIASKGEINKDMLKKLNDLPYYGLKPPKSLGLEWVNENVFPLIDSYNLSVKDVLRTFVEHVALQVSEAILGSRTVLVTGGGAYNDFLMSRLQVFSNGQFVIPSNDIVEYKEALIFGLLGVLKMRNEVNCLRSVTGAKEDHSSGKIFDF